MMPVFIGAIMGAIAGVLEIAGLKFFKEEGSLIVAWIGDVILGAVVGLLVSVINCVTNPEFVPIESTITEHELVQVSDHFYADTNGYVAGGIFLIHGAINTSPESAFSYYEKQDDYFQLKTVEADKCIIKYTDERPRLVIEDTHETKSLPILGEWALFMSHNPAVKTTYTFYIPEGSIEESYSLGG